MTCCLWSGHCSYWLDDRSVVWCVVIVYGDNLLCLTGVMMRSCIPSYILVRISRLPFPFAAWGCGC